MLSIVISLLAQTGDTTRIVDRLCPGCTISIDTVTVIGDDDGPGSIRGPQIVVSRDSFGRYLVGGAASAGSISVFDSTGRFLRLVGRPGGGPGEYRRVWRITPFDGGVVVTDDLALRHTILSRSLEYVRSIPAGAREQASLIPAPGGGSLEAAVVRRGADTAYALVFRDPSGAVRGRASAVRARRRDDGHDPATRTLSASPDGSEVWAAHREDFLIERCVFRTASCVRIGRTAEWFPVRAELTPSFDERMTRYPPAPELLGVAQEGDRHLWIMSLVADEEWRSGLRLGGVHPGVGDPHRYWDTIIEIVDLPTLAVIARRRLDDALLFGLVRGGHTAVYREDAEGVPRVHALRLSLRDATSRR